MKIYELKEREIFSYFLKSNPRLKINKQNKKLNCHNLFLKRCYTCTWSIKKLMNKIFCYVSPKKNNYTLKFKRYKTKLGHKNKMKYKTAAFALQKSLKGRFLLRHFFIFEDRMWAYFGGYSFWKKQHAKLPIPTGVCIVPA